MDALSKSHPGLAKGAHIAGAVAGAVGRGTGATAKAVFGNHKNSAENKLDQNQNVLNKYIEVYSECMI